MLMIKGALSTASHTLQFYLPEFQNVHLWCTSRFFLLLCNQTVLKGLFFFTFLQMEQENQQLKVANLKQTEQIMSLQDKLQGVNSTIMRLFDNIKVFSPCVFLKCGRKTREIFHKQYKKHANSTQKGPTRSRTWDFIALRWLSANHSSTMLPYIHVLFDFTLTLLFNLTSINFICSSFLQNINCIYIFIH